MRIGEWSAALFFSVVFTFTTAIAQVPSDANLQKEEPAAEQRFRSQKLDRTSLKLILSKQGFSGELQGKVNLTLLGDMECGSTTLHVYYYTWEERNPPGRAIHYSQRLIFIRNRTYLGHYVVSDRPVLAKPNALRFPVSQEDGNSVKCEQDGLPRHLYLDGGDRVLSK